MVSNIQTCPELRNRNLPITFSYAHVLKWEKLHFNTDFRCGYGVTYKQL